MATFTELKAEIVRFGGMGSSTADTTSVAAWAKGGLRMMTRVCPWPWTRTAISWSLTANIYAYSIRTILASLIRIDTKSIRYGGGANRLTWGTIEAIDRALQPSWKDTATTGGTPQYVARVGTEVWIAGKPSADFVTSYPTLYGYGWRHENWDEEATVNGGHLLLPDDYFEVAVECALAYGFHEEDDPRAETFLARFRNIHLPDMMSTLDPGASSVMRMPRLGSDSGGTDDAYGDA